MNKLLTCLALCCGLATPVLAQGNAPAKHPAQQTLEIFADSFEYDSPSGRAVYTTHVRVNDPDMTINCELLTVVFSQPAKAGAGSTTVTNAATGGLSPVAGSKIETIVAEQNVVIVNKKDGSKATGKKAVYQAATDVVELTGDPVLETEQGKLYGDLVVLDRAKNKLRATGHVHMELHSDAMRRGKSPGAKGGAAKPKS